MMDFFISHVKVDFYVSCHDFSHKTVIIKLSSIECIIFIVDPLYDLTERRSIRIYLIKTD